MLDELLFPFHVKITIVLLFELNRAYYVFHIMFARQERKHNMRTGTNVMDFGMTRIIIVTLEILNIW